MSATSDAVAGSTAGVQMQKWICVICGFIYDPAIGMPEYGIAAGIRFEDLPDDWTCPECGSPKSAFEPYDE